MGAFEGGLSFRTYFVEGEPPNDFHEDYLARIAKNCFVPLHADGEEERRVGWVPLQEPLESEFSRGLVFYNQYLVLGYRVDKWSIPAAIFKAHYGRAMRQRLVGRENVKPSRRERDEVKAEVLGELKRQILPTMKVVDMVWNMAEHTLRFWTHAGALCEEFSELFEETFSLRLVPDASYTSAMRLGLDEAALAALLELDPSRFGDTAVA